METTTIFIIIVVSLLGVIGLIFLGIWLKKHWMWIKFSKDLRSTRKKLSHNTGVLFILNKGDSIGIPRFINLEEYSKEIGQKRYLLMKEQMQGMKFLGMPMIILPSEDTKTSVGIYYQQTDKDANPLFYKKNGKWITTDKGAKIPMLSALKPSTSLPPDLVNAIIKQESLNLSIKDFMAFIKKNKNIVYFILGMIGLGFIGSVVSYLIYQMLQEQLPTIMSRTAECVDMNAVCKETLNTLKNMSGVIVK